MANIRFSSEEAFNRFLRCSEMCRDLHLPHNKTIDGCISRLMHWHSAEVVIGCDFDELSFTFYEVYDNGLNGVCGGIIFHGKRDGYGSGKGPTFSVCLEPTNGYSIHT